MKRASFRFYAELNDLLPPERRMAAFEYPFRGRETVKHLIEAAGVPHTEVDLVLVNGEPADFARVVEDGDRVSVYPVFEAFDIRTVSHVRPEPLRQIRFVLDGHLGRLASYLRMMGFDTLYRNDYSDQELARVSAGERRVLLTRDRGLLKRSAVTHGHLVRETHPRRQVAEVLDRFDLFRAAAPFTRCLCCNDALQAASRETVIGQVPPRSREHADEFRQCAGCGKVYWNGSHHRRMRRFIEQTLNGAGKICA